MKRVGILCMLVIYVAVCLHDVIIDHRHIDHLERDQSSVVDHKCCCSVEHSQEHQSQCTLVHEHTVSEYKNLDHSLVATLPSASLLPMPDVEYFYPLYNKEPDKKLSEIISEALPLRAPPVLIG